MAAASNTISASAKLLSPSSISSVRISSLTSSLCFPRRLLRSLTSSTISFRSPKPSFPFVVGSSSISTSSATKAIAVGDKLPDATLSYFDSADELQTITVSDLTKGKKAILFAVPGAFTPTCSQKHLPGFVDKAKDLNAKGVEVIACISVNDAFVMKAWKENLNIVGDDVLLLSDGNGEFTSKLGVELDLSDKPVGLGVRSRRYALLAEDGVVKVLNLEEGGAFTNSSAEDMLNAL